MLWRLEVSSFVLPAQAARVREDDILPRLDLDAFHCRTVVLATPDRVQYVLFANAGRRFQMVVHGEHLTENVSLFVDAIVAPPLVERRLLLLRRLSDLVAVGDLSQRFYPPDPRSRRLAVVLQVLDGSLTSASHREIAIALFGRQRVEVDWHDPGNYIRDKVRRALRRGRYLMNHGYLSFLK